jgi:hypothetical protein
MSGAACLKKARAVRTLIYDAPFPTGAAVGIAAYTPLVGPACHATLCLWDSGEVYAGAPSGVAGYGSYYKNNNGNARTPLIVLPTNRIECEFKGLPLTIDNVAIAFRKGITPGDTSGNTVFVKTTAVSLTIGNNPQQSVSMTLGNSDIISFTDDGTSAVGAIKVYVNGVLKITSGYSSTATGSNIGLVVSYWGYSGLDYVKVWAT